MPDDDTDLELIAGEVVSEAFDGPGDWLPPAEAARRIGVSERTLWRRVTAGQLLRKVVSGKALVLVPVAGSVPNPSDLTVPDAPDGLALAVIEELRRQHDEAAERLTRQAGHIEELERQTGKLEAERDQARAEVARMQSYSWWKRLFGYN